ncbi:sigma-70 family RNA polymerase sigma factor [Leucobacter zeae]|nr:sigma-70 family RNA polymerase sigma factor [Leucobacter zeae]
MARPLSNAKRSEMELLELSRTGDRAAFGELWHRHAGAVLAAIRRHTSLPPEDIRQETFLRIWEQLRAGKGPRTSLRAYAIITARSVASEVGRRRTVVEVTGVADDALEHLAGSAHDASIQLLEDHFTASVFRSLSPRWREVLWYRDVEGLAVREFCHLLGLNENSASALLKRAREGFKQAWITSQLHVPGGGSASCRWVLERLSQYVRGQSSIVTAQKIESLIAVCGDCQQSVAFAQDLNRHLEQMLGSPSGRVQKQRQTAADAHVHEPSGPSRSTSRASSEARDPRTPGTLSFASV